ncbi:MAG: hypothetical protein WBB01_02865, partial [Phormidesmis sp.]
MGSQRPCGPGMGVERAGASAEGIHSPESSPPLEKRRGAIGAIPSASVRTAMSTPLDLSRNGST